jgi:hypothetical protein
MKPISPAEFARTNRLIQHSLEHLLRFSNVRHAAVYISPRFVAKATRQRKPDRRDTRETFLVTVGAPNYYERRFIKACQKAGEPFPVRKVQLKFYPTAKAK